MAIANHLAITRWADQIDGPPESRSMGGSSVFARGDTIYSYGTHFPMATIMRKANGEARFILVNGDRYSVTTAGHQSHVRGAISRKNVPALIVPFTALSAAGIDPASIEPLEVLADSWTTTYRTVSADELPPYQRDQHNSSGCIEVYRQSSWETIHPNADDTYTIPQDRHWLGEAVFRAAVTDTSYVEVSREDAERHDYDTVRYQGTRTLYLRVIRSTRKAKFLSAFDHNEARLCYFLCELPRTSAATVEDAFEALKPKPVKAACEAGLEVQRQGDIFAIPTSLTTRELKSRARKFEESNWQGSTVVVEQVAVRKRAILLNTNHTATEVIVTKDGDTYARGTLRHEPGGFRQSDHARIRLGDGRGWFRILKNTVPTASSSGRRTGTAMSNANQSGSNRAWTMGGSVD